MYIPERVRKVALYIAICLFSMSLFTACSGLHVSGGLIGSVLSFLGVLALVFTISASQSSCGVGPCLQPIPPDGVQKDGGDGKDTIQACLSIAPDRSSTDKGTQMEPCLGAPLPEDNKQGFLQSTPGEAPNTPHDPARFAAADRPSERQQAIARLKARGILPADVAGRLSNDNDKG